MEAATYYVDDDGYIVHNASRDTVANIVDKEHIEPLTQILGSHNDLLQACKARENALWHEIKTLTSCTPGQPEQLSPDEQDKYIKLHNEREKITKAIAGNQ